MQKFDNQVVKAATQATLPPMRPAGGSQSTRQTSKISSSPAQTSARNKDKRTKKQAAPKAPQLVPRLDLWLRCLGRPFDNVEVKCPVNYNPVPTIMTSVARTTSTFRQTVAANSTVQLALFGGHGNPSDTDAMDGVSYHARQVNIGGSVVSIGPVQSGAAGGWVNALISTGLTINNARAEVATAVVNVPVTYDQALPYVGAGGDGVHTRWKLTAMGVRVQNATELAVRAGNVNHCQPANGTYLTSQSAFAKYPTWRTTQEANTGTLEISWIPRPQDLAFWHSVTTAESAAATDLVAADLFVWMNNEATVPQDYYIQIVEHWEIGGDNLVAISSPAVLQPNDRAIVEPMLDVVKFTASSSLQAPSIAASIASAMSPLVSRLGDEAMAAVKKHAPEVLAVAGSVFGL